jgi:hypothetical protein
MLSLFCNDEDGIFYVRGQLEDFVTSGGTANEVEDIAPGSPKGGRGNDQTTGLNWHKKLTLYGMFGTGSCRATERAGPWVAFVGLAWNKLIQEEPKSDSRS